MTLAGTNPSARPVLIVEDEASLRRVLRLSLSRAGFVLVEAGTAAEAASMLQQHDPELVLLDLTLPDGDGLEVLRHLREWSAVPVIVVSARGREAAKVEALDAGADDYLTKPFGTRELLARIRVALRRAREANLAPRSPTLTIGPLEIDLPSGVVHRHGLEVNLTPIEYRLLVLFARHAGMVVTHRQLLTEVWGPTRASDRDSLRVFVSGLRKKIEDDPARPSLLETVSGVGYRLRDTGSPGVPPVTRSDRSAL